MYNHIALLIGHVVGDYLFQNDWMAKNKGNKGWRGHWICCLHCSVYAVMVAAAVVLGGWRYAEHGVLYSLWIAWMIGWVTHYPIDRWALSMKWMKFYGQTREGPFFPCVYIGVDNGAHLILMWILFSVV